MNGDEFNELKLVKQSVEEALRKADKAESGLKHAAFLGRAACGAALCAIAGTAFLGGMAMSGASNPQNLAAPVYAPVFAGPNAGADNGNGWRMPRKGVPNVRRAGLEADDWLPLEEPRWTPVPARLVSAEAESDNKIELSASKERKSPARAEVQPSKKKRTFMLPVPRYRRYADWCRTRGIDVPEGSFCSDASGHEMFCMRLSSKEASAFDRWDLEAYRTGQEAAWQADARQAPREPKPCTARTGAQQASMRPGAARPAMAKDPDGLIRGLADAPAAAAPAPAAVPSASDPDALQRELERRVVERLAPGTAPKPAPTANVPSADSVQNAFISSKAGIEASEAAKGPARPIQLFPVPLQKEGKLRSDTSVKAPLAPPPTITYNAFTAIRPERTRAVLDALAAKPRIAREELDALLRAAGGIRFAGSPETAREALFVLVQSGCPSCMAAEGLLAGSASKLPFPIVLLPVGGESGQHMYLPRIDATPAEQLEASKMGSEAGAFLAKLAAGGRAVTPTYIWAMDGIVHAGSLSGEELTAVVNLLSAHAYASRILAGESPEAVAAAMRGDNASPDAAKPEASAKPAGSGAPEAAHKPEAQKKDDGRQAPAAQKPEAKPAEKDSGRHGRGAAGGH